MAALSEGRRPALVFIGFMGAGKTTAARAADPDAVDVDELMEQRLGESIADFFAREGEEAFREREAVLAGAYRDKFGGDHVDDVRAALAAYEERIGWKRRRPSSS